MVAQFWRSQNPIGKRLQVGGRWRRVVGVAKNVKFESMLDAPRALFYLPLRQNFSTQGSIFIRTRQAPEALSRILARQIRALDPRIAPYEVITLREQVRRATSSQRIAVTLLAMFGALAMLLAGIGLYGTMAYAVSQRKRELGLRTALGAAPTVLLRLVLSQGLRLTAIGIALGGVAAFASTRLIAVHAVPGEPARSARVRRRARGHGACRAAGLSGAGVARRANGSRHRASLALNHKLRAGNRPGSAMAIAA